MATTPLVAICVALTLAAIPLFRQVAGWTTLLFFAAAGVRLYLNRRGARLPPLALKVAFFGLCAGAIGMSYGSMIGIAPGLSILLVLVSLKLIETNSARDFQVLALLGYFLALCALFFSQDLLLWLYVGAVVLLLTATLVHFHRGGHARGFAPSLKVAGTLLVQAVPIIVLLFLLFPRSGAFFRFQFSRSLLGASGMSDRLSPGSVAALALNSDIAFRASFPDGNPPPLSRMYWRGAVLWRGNGMTWVTDPRLPVESHRDNNLGGEPIRQSIHLQAHGGRWLFALDRPFSDSERYEYLPGGYIQRQRLIFNTFRYEVVSRPENQQTKIPEVHRAVATAIPPGVSPRVRELVASWTSKTSEPQELVNLALQHFRAGKFSYSLEPGTYGEAPLDEFLFERRVGFCEHYAATFATLMRVAGVPSRIVIGYLGGENNPNRLGDYVIVRQSDAHAWVEVWLEGIGWRRVDPTEAIAPERISSGLASYLQSRATAGEESASGGSAVALGWREMMREAQLAWDSVNHYWELRVLNFDEESQRSFFELIGFAKASWLEVLTWTGVVIMLLLAVIAFWLRRPTRRRGDPASRAWSEFCRRLARAGVPRLPAEGPIAFGERAASSFGVQGDAIRSIAQLYAEVRYAAAAPDSQLLLRAVRKLPELEASPDRKIGA
jgi:transglutaminase-like putative cysteine protease